MPLEHLHQRWHFHQRMNKKVSVNLDRLTRIAAISKSKQDILDALHPWRLSISLRFNNTFAILQFGASLILLIGAIWFFHSHVWLLISWLIAIAICTYAFLSFENKDEVDRTITLLTDAVYQFQYEIYFSKFPILDPKVSINPTYMMTKIKQGFNCLNEGNAGNEIKRFASTIWTVNGHEFPVLLLHYIAVQEAVVKSPNGQEIKKRIESNYWGACVFEMPNLAFMISNTQQKYIRYPVKWTSSDIQLNRRFNIAGQQELELARNLTPQRILALANHLQTMKGTLMFHDEMRAFCYLSQQNIFQIDKPPNPIQDISMLRGHLRTLKASHYERMQINLCEIIRHFHDKPTIEPKVISE